MSRGFEIIVAVDEQLGIGAAGGLPWRLPSEMRHFTRTTRETRDPDKVNAVFMGRVNWQSIPDKYRPLPGRRNLVLSRQPGYAVPEGVQLASSIDQAMERLDRPEIERIFCLGGGRVYAEAIELPACESLILTRVHATYDCDTFFPRFEHRFELAEVLGEGADGGVTYQIQLWKPKPA